MRDPIQDDYKNFFMVDKDLKNLGMSDSDRLAVYTTISAVLHLGNIGKILVLFFLILDNIVKINISEFEDDPDDNRGGCRVMEKAEKSLQITGSLMGLDPDELRRALTARVMQAAKGGYKGTVIMVPLKTHEASNARDALAKAIYSRLFDYIVGCINNSIPFQVKNLLNRKSLLLCFFVNRVSWVFLEKKFWINLLVSVANSICKYLHKSNALYVKKISVMS